MHDTQRHHCLRTPDKLAMGDVISLTGDDHHEVVQRVHRLDNGQAFVVQTSTNAHYCRADLPVRVIATWIPGVGVVHPAFGGAQ